MLNHKQLLAVTTFVERMNDALIRSRVVLDPQTGIVTFDDEELGLLVAPASLPGTIEEWRESRDIEGYRFEPMD